MNIIKAFLNPDKLKYIDRISITSYFLNSVLGDCSRVYSFSRVSDSKIGNYTYISHQCIINNCEIGNYCSIARGVKIGLGKHPTNFISTSPIFYSLNNPLKKIITKSQEFTEFEKTTIGNDVWIGANALLADGVVIGDGAIIGANAVVTKDIQPFAIAVGCPAKVIKYRFSEENIEKLLTLKWWEKDISKLENHLNLFQNEVDDNVINNLLHSLLLQKKS